MIFNLLLFFPIISGISSTITDSEEDLGEKNPIMFLIPSRSGFHYKKSDNADGTVNITYNCAVGPRKDGTIQILDDNHPYEMKSLAVENCYNITMDFSKETPQYGDYYSDRNYLKKFEELHFKNIHTLTFTSSNSYNYLHQRDISIYVKNVRFFVIESDSLRSLSNSPHARLNLNIKNISHATLENNALGPEISNLYLEGIRKGIAKTMSVLIQDVQGFLTIKNSNFETVETKSFVFNGSEVNIFNSSFKNLESHSFSVIASESFIFSENYVQKMQNCFSINSKNVQIISNTFDEIKKPWLSDIVIQNNEKLGVLNISKNTINILPRNFFLMNSESQPDIIRFYNNYFNCNCKMRNLIDEYQTDIKNTITEIFLHKNNQNLCVNFGNCPLGTVLGHMNDVCRGEFICNQEKEFDDSLKIYLTSILSTLNTIANELEMLITEKNSTMISKKNLTPTGQPVTTTDS